MLDILDGIHIAPRMTEEELRAAELALARACIRGMETARENLAELDRHLLEYLSARAQSDGCDLGEGPVPTA